MSSPAPTQGTPLKLGPAVLLLLASSLTVLAGAIVAPSLLGLRQAFAHQAGVELLTRLVLSAPALGVVLTGSAAGRLADRLGRRRVLIGGLVVYGLGGTSGLWLPTLPAILAGRFVLGIGVAAVMTSATTLIADLTTGPARGRFLGIQAAFMGAGGLVFLTLGGWLAELAWRLPFAVYAASGLLIPAVLVVLKPDRPKGHQRQRQGALPHFMLLLYGAAFVGMLIFYLLPTQLPFLLNQRLAAAGSAIGLTLGLMTVTAATTSFLFARIQRRLGSPWVLALTFLIMAPGLGLIGWSSTWPGALAGVAVFGVGLGLLAPNLNLWASGLVAEARRGRALGNLATAVFLGQFLSPMVSAPIAARGVTLGHLFLGASVTAAAIGLALLGFLPHAREAAAPGELPTP